MLDQRQNTLEQVSPKKPCKMPDEVKNKSGEPQFYEAMKRFVETQPDTSAADFMPIITRRFFWREEEFELIIRAAQFLPRKFPAQFYFLSERERLIEQTLRLLATAGNPLFDAQSKCLCFSLKQLTEIISGNHTTRNETTNIENDTAERELKTKAILSRTEMPVGEKMPLLTEDDIKFALEALALAAFTVRNGNQEFYFYPIEQFETSETDGEIYYRIRLSNISLLD